MEGQQKRQRQMEEVGRKRKGRREGKAKEEKEVTYDNDSVY